MDNESPLEGYTAVLELDIETYPMPGLSGNALVRPGVKLRGLSWTGIMKYDEKTGEYKDVTDEDMDAIVYTNNTITIDSSDVAMKFTSPNGFTVRQLFDAILDVEKVARPEREWWGGIDAHHVFFSRFGRAGGNKFYVEWDS